MNLEASSGVNTTFAKPALTALFPAAIPVTMTFCSTSDLGDRIGFISILPGVSFALHTVSGLACVIKMFFGKDVSRSIAHSMSWGVP